MSTLNPISTPSVLTAPAGPHPLFGIPELVRYILNEVSSPATLARCARVSQFWAQEAIPILWRGDKRDGSEWCTPYLFILARIPFDRLSMYIHHIEFLTIGQDRSMVKVEYEFDPLFDAKLWSGFRGRYVKVCLAQNAFNATHVRPVLNTNLEELYLFFTVCVTDLFEDFKKSSPKLSKLTSGWKAGFYARWEPVIEYLRSSAINHLSLTRQFERYITSGVLEQLMTIRSWRTLNLSQLSIANAIILQMRLPTSLSLSSLSLRVDGGTTGLQRLLVNLPLLEELSIAVSGRNGNINDDVLQPITDSCHYMIRLRLDTGFLTLDGERLVNMARVTPRMKTFTWLRDIVIRDVPTHLCNAVTHWPLLTALTISTYMNEDIEGSNLLSIGSSCPRLVRLVLSAELGTGEFMNLVATVAEGTVCPFPNLRDLGVDIRLMDRRPGDDGLHLFPNPLERFRSMEVDSEDIDSVGRYHHDKFDVLYSSRNYHQNSVETTVDDNEPTFGLTSFAVERAASKVEDALLGLMPQLCAFRMSGDDSPWSSNRLGYDNLQNDAEGRIVNELHRRFDLKCRPVRCHLRRWNVCSDWCECWRIFQN